jgi:hypothetical protein
VAFSLSLSSYSNCPPCRGVVYENASLVVIHKDGFLQTSDVGDSMVRVGEQEREIDVSHQRLPWITSHTTCAPVTVRAIAT